MQCHQLICFKSPYILSTNKTIKMEAYYLIEDGQWNDGEGFSYVSDLARVLPIVELEYVLHLLASIKRIEEPMMFIRYLKDKKSRDGSCVENIYWRRSSPKLLRNHSYLFILQQIKETILHNDINGFSSSQILNLMHVFEFLLFLDWRLQSQS